VKTLRPYQQSANDSLFDYLFTKKGHPLVVAPVGAGKSLLIAEFIRQVHERYPNTRIVMLSHVKELLVQDAEELRGQYPTCDFGFYSASLKEKKLYNSVTFATIQSVHSKIASFNRCPEIIIVDECFTGETMINTTAGKKRVDKVRLGDIVYNATGCGEITAISKKISNIIYKVKLDNGQQIRCTGNHPFFTEQGWVECRKLDKGRKLIGIQNMQELWTKFSPVEIGSDEARENGGNSSTETEFSKNKILLNILCEEDGELHVDSRHKGKSFKTIKRDRTQAISAWWERQRNDKITRNDAGNSWDGMDTRISDSNEGSEVNEIISNVLQSRLGAQREKISDRVGRGNSLRKNSRKGQKERRVSDVVRVENIEIEECSGGEFVYNLQVGGHPSYFANGVLVHNCHLISHNDATQYRRFIDSVVAINPNVKVIGYTGTPFRADTGRLDEGNGKLFDDIAYEISIGYMIENGYLCKPAVPKISTVMDVTGVKTRNGDYIASQLEAKIDVDPLTKACVAEMLEQGVDRKKWLIFTCGVIHCGHVRDALREAGISAEMVTGDMPALERDTIIKRYRNGEFTALVNVMVLTVGFNVPDIDMLVFMRPTKSPVLYIQCTGRGVRPVYADGFDLNTKDGRLAAIAASKKKDCRILDFGGVVSNLGPIDTIDIRKKGHVEREEGEGVALFKRCPECSAICAPAQLYCYECSHSFIDLNKKAEKHKQILSTDEPPQVERCLGMVQKFHAKKIDPDNPVQKPATMQVTYSTMSGPYKEWVCFDHPKAGTAKETYAYDKAVKWHRDRIPDVPPPASVAEALLIKYPCPTTITVKREDKYWRILSVGFEERAVQAPAEEMSLADFEEIGV
jgi:DNA repair protein RadD